MGSTIISKKQAAQLLGVCERSVYKYISQGILHTERSGRMIGVYEEEVLQLRSSGGTPDRPLKIAFNPASFAKLYEEVQYLKSRVHTLEHVFDVTAHRLNLPDDELYRQYMAAKTYSQEGWPPHVEQQWADTFLRLGPDDLRQLKAYTKDEHPWKPFYLFCACMNQSMYNKYLKDQLVAALHHLKKLVYLWGQILGESPRIIETMVREEAEPMQRLINKLSSMKNPAGKSPH